MWTKQRTRDGDDLSTLARAYGTSIDKVLSANGIRTPEDHTDRYLAAKAQEYLIAVNLPRPMLSRLVLERDIQQWVRHLGGECEELRAGSKAQIQKIMACAPGCTCHFTSDNEVVLPARKRAVVLHGLGEASIVEVVTQLNSLKTEARKVADKVVDEASVFADGDEVKGWRDGFVFNVDKFVGEAGRLVEQNKLSLASNKVKLIKDYIASAGSQASGFVNVGFFNNASSTLLNTVASIASSVADLASSLATSTQPAPTPAPAPARTPPKDSSALAAVRAGTATLKRGAKGAAVTELQNLLCKVNLTVQVDGAFGPQTEAAVKDFQKFRDLPVTGIVDATFMRDLDAVIAVGGKATMRSRPAPKAKAPAPAPVVKTEQVVAPPPPPPPVVARKDNTVIYAAAAAAVLLVAAVALKKKRAA